MANVRSRSSAQGRYPLLRTLFSGSTVSASGNGVGVTARTLYLAAVFDAFSRLPLAAMTFQAKPGGSRMSRLFKKAVALFGKPKYLITDLGGEFIASGFQKVVKRAGVKPRFASADSIRATARLERFWKTLKQLAGVRLIPVIDIGDLERRLSAALAYYTCQRPHTALGDRTPLQSFLGESAPTLKQLPRGRKREPCAPSPFRIAFDPGGFPVLAPQAA
ncbi:MAG: DDE-type integrase/transposase/recombinase [Anaerolineaceae bacterium]